MTTRKTTMWISVRGELVRGMALLAQCEFVSAQDLISNMVEEARSEYYSDLEIEPEIAWSEGDLIWEDDQFLMVYIADEYEDGTEIEREREGHMLRDMLQDLILEMFQDISRENA